MTGTPRGRADRTAVDLTQAGHALAQGRAVVVPNPAPLTHVVTARHAPTVNEAKGRPAGQPVALWAHHPDTLGALDQIWKLGPDQKRTARRLLTRERLTVLIPVHGGSGTPDWATPAIKDGWMLLFGARWQPLRPLLDEHPLLYVSSANRTGQQPAATTADALAMFSDTTPVLTVPEPEDATAPEPATQRRATTTVRLLPDGRLELHRRGAQDQHHAEPARYLAELEESCGQAPRDAAGPTAGDG